MTVFISYLAPSITSFIQYRKASDHWNESSYEINLKLFDRYCYECNPDTYAELTQETADSWCRQRENEQNNSCRSMTLTVHNIKNIANENRHRFRHS